MCEIMELRSADWVVDVDQQGGAIRQARWRGLDILRPYRSQWDAFAAMCNASFPLVPYSNRVRDGRFNFEGVEYQIPSFRPGDRHALHGVGWLARWAGEQPRRNLARLILRHDGPAWPWRLEVTHEIEIERDRLVFRLSLTNTDKGPQPVGLGFHPYFPRDEDTRLSFDSTGVWTGEAAGLSEHLMDVPEHWRFSEGCPLPEEEIDHCFAGWSGRARIDWPKSGLSVAISGDRNLDHAVVFIPPDQKYFCFEPVSHMSNAINQFNDETVTGLRHLAPGDAYTVSMVLMPSLAGQS